jgi:DNA-binding NtrC family response regulator
VITGFATKETADEAMRSGAVEFIAKPFKMSQLKNIISALLSEDDRADEQHHTDSAD